MPSSNHRVWADIDLSALRRNMGRVVGRLQPGTGVLAVVKADAYGHGAVPVARALVGEPGLWGFGVGDSNEALELRAAGIDAPILILGTIIADEVPQVVSHDVRVCIHSMDRIRSLEQEAERQGRRSRVHLMVDTGMGRLGAQPPRAAELARMIDASPWLELEGLATHVSASRPGHPFTHVQHQRLRDLLGELAVDGIRPPQVHFANTAAILGGIGTDLPLVRPGISLYGMIGHEHAALAPDFEPVLSLRTQVVYLKDVPAGTPIGYNGTHVTTRVTRVATLPIGYNDGLSYRLSNLGQCVVRGALAPIVGSISMDYTTIDVGDIADVSVGDVVTFLGADGEHVLSVPEVASRIGTIPYEVTCAVGKRVARVYRKDAQAPELRPQRAIEQASDGAPGAPSVLPQQGPKIVPPEPLEGDALAEGA
ncbi:MAG: alanine racemase [Planctomycetes bacterium]|nr:alanine racemase [Planctomycetota bacterium]